MLIAGASSTLFPCKNCVCFRKAYIFQTIVFKEEKEKFGSKRHIQLVDKNKVCLKSKSCELHSGASRICIPVRIEFLFERNT
jgi:deoxycytidylate deaminase